VPTFRRYIQTVLMASSSPGELPVLEVSTVSTT